MKATAIKAAKEAGKILLRYYKRPKAKTHKKGKYDIGAEADIAAENAVLKIIKKKFPLHNIDAEESGKQKHKSPYTWYIDALDGTINFTRRLPLWCVSVTLTKNNQPILAVILNPLTNELYTAEKGKGAFKNGKKIHVSNRRLADANISTDFTTVEKNRGSWFTLMKKFSKDMLGMRILHTSALGMAFVAEGKLDAYIKNHIKHEDTIASLLITEAGGKAYTEKSKGRGLFIASNKSLFRQIRAKFL